MKRKDIFDSKGRAFFILKPYSCIFQHDNTVEVATPGFDDVILTYRTLDETQKVFSELKADIEELENDN